MLSIDYIKNIFYKIFDSYPNEITYINKGVMNHKFKITYKDNDYVIRQFIIDKHIKIHYEPLILKKLKEIGVNVPVYITSSLELQDNNFHYIIYEWINGNDLTDYVKVKNQNLIANNIFSNLKRLEEYSFNDYGEIGKQRFRTWSDFLKTSLYDGFFYLKKNPQLNWVNYDKLALFIESALSKLDNRNIDSKFIWADISLDNIIIDSNLNTHFIDFEHSFSGDFLTTLSYFYTKNCNNEIFKKLFNFYNENNEIDDDLFRLYCILRLMRISKYIDNKLPNNTQRSSIGHIFPGLQIELEKFKK